MALAQAVERGDFTGERAERGYLDVLFLGHLLHVQVVVAQGFLLGADLVVVGGLQQHASVGAGHAGDGEEAYDGSGDKDVSVVQRNRDLAEAAIVFTSDKDDVVAFCAQGTSFREQWGSFRWVREYYANANAICWNAFTPYQSGKDESNLTEVV